jgi:hypothetical protein
MGVTFPDIDLGRAGDGLLVAGTQPLCVSAAAARRAGFKAPLEGRP